MFVMHDVWLYILGYTSKKTLDITINLKLVPEHTTKNVF